MLLLLSSGGLEEEILFDRGFELWWALYLGIIQVGVCRDYGKGSVGSATVLVGTVL